MHRRNLNAQAASTFLLESSKEPKCFFSTAWRAAILNKVVTRTVRFDLLKPHRFLANDAGDQMQESVAINIDRGFISARSFLIFWQAFLVWRGRDKGSSLPLPLYAVVGGRSWGSFRLTRSHHQSRVHLPPSSRVCGYCLINTIAFNVCWFPAIFLGRSWCCRFAVLFRDCPSPADRSDLGSLIGLLFRMPSAERIFAASKLVKQIFTNPSGSGRGKPHRTLFSRKIELARTQADPRRRRCCQYRWLSPSGKFET